MGPSAHLDTFVRDHLPPVDQQPVFSFDLPELQYPPRLNASTLLDRAIDAGFADKAAVLSEARRYTYAQLLDAACRIAEVLVEDLGLVPGNRVLLHAPNTALAIAAWFGVLRAGGVVVATMPMLRAGELQVVIDKAQISHALFDPALTEAVSGAQSAAPVLRRPLPFDELERRMAEKPGRFPPCPTAADDTALIAFTSGTTGKPKGCIHFHRDVLAMADTFARHLLKPEPEDVFCGTPPFAFTFGLGAAVVFPAAFGAATALCSRPGYDELLACIARHGVTTLFTAPTAYRALLKDGSAEQLRSLKTCVSAGEALPAATSDAWFERTGIRIVDGIGSTEMIHIFISAAGDEVRPGATGKPVPGYTAALLDDHNHLIEGPGQGRLAIRGPTGCRYLADERQRNYVIDGWNVTGDIYRRDEDGYYWFVSRADDMIVSSGYNIGAPEVEQAILTHPAVLETAVVGAADEQRGQLVKAFIVLHDPDTASDALRCEIQDHVKRTIAPYKYPRALEFVRELPKTQTGKIQRFRLRDSEAPAP
ncbi:MAG TPA: benzoate-CoA ligase family protein [Caulobacteraceae bacterium]|jgi:2-aminobenzoate-CoA ligase